MGTFHFQTLKWSVCSKVIIYSKGLLILISRQAAINKVYLYAKNPYQAKHQLIINKHESAGQKLCNGPKALTKYSIGMDEFTKILMNLIQIKHLKHW